MSYRHIAVTAPGQPSKAHFGVEILDRITVGQLIARTVLPDGVTELYVEMEDTEDTTGAILHIFHRDEYGWIVQDDSEWETLILENDFATKIAIGSSLMVGEEGIGPIERIVAINPTACDREELRGSLATQDMEDDILVRFGLRPPSRPAS